MYVLSGDAAVQFQHIILPSEADQKAFYDAMRGGEDHEGLQRKQCINRVMENRENVLQLKERYPNAVISSEADEEGNFKIGGVPPATLLKIVAFGRAGANAGMWIGFKSLDAGKDESVKLSSPSLVCLDPYGLAKF